MSPAVHLHIGEPKTGTTYLQEMLFHNRESLLADGVLLPGSKLDQIKGGHDVLGRAQTAGTHETAGAWAALAALAAQFSGGHAVVSMEMLTRARPAQARRAVEAFGAGADVRVVVTTREIGRLAPARWQESVQFRRSWTLAQYLDGVFDGDRASDEAARHFWGAHDTARTVTTWAGTVGLDKVTVVTVPPSPAQPDLLWRRFGEALGIPVDHCEPAEQANASLGRESAELMRRVNEALQGSGLGDDAYARICRRLLGKTVLPSRTAAEGRISLPARYDAAARLASEQAVADLRALGVRVVGDLDDLLHPPGAAAGGTADDDPLDEALVAAAAVAAVAALVEQNARLSRNART